MSGSVRITLFRSDARAISIALDELEAYSGVIGDEDEAHARQKWAVQKLHKLLARFDALTLDQEPVS